MNEQNQTKAHNRREKLLELTRCDIKSFDDFTEETGFSRNEVAFHLARLLKLKKLFSYELYEGCLLFTQDKGQANRSRQRRRMRSFNEFMHGCPDPIHIFGVGYINPHTREGKRWLDP